MSPALEIAIEVAPEALPCTEAEFHAQVRGVLDGCGFPGSLSLAVVDDEAMRAVNRDYHDCDAATDVLAFPLRELGGAAPEGGPPGFDAEVVVSMDTARREAERRGVQPLSELLLYVTHGVLHLLGEDDHDPVAARRMHERTLRILESLGHANSISMPDGEVRSDSTGVAAPAAPDTPTTETVRGTG